jgi:hypothetical protein
MTNSFEIRAYALVRHHKKKVEMDIVLNTWQPCPEEGQLLKIEPNTFTASKTHHTNSYTAKSQCKIQALFSKSL